MPETKMQEKVPTSIITTIYNTLAMFSMLEKLENRWLWAPKNHQKSMPKA